MYGITELVEKFHTNDTVDGINVVDIDTEPGSIKQRYYSTIQSIADSASPEVMWHGYEAVLSFGGGAWRQWYVLRSEVDEEHKHVVLAKSNKADHWTAFLPPKEDADLLNRAINKARYMRLAQEIANPWSKLSEYGIATTHKTVGETVFELFAINLHGLNLGKVMTYRRGQNYQRVEVLDNFLLYTMAEQIETSRFTFTLPVSTEGDPQENVYPEHTVPLPPVHTVREKRVRPTRLSRAARASLTPATVEEETRYGLSLSEFEALPQWERDLIRDMEERQKNREVIHLEA